MEDQSKSREPELTGDVFELEGEQPEELEAAVRDALEAVERCAAEEAVTEATEGDSESVSEAEVDGLQSELEDLRDRSMRTLADFENYRKRVERERAEERKYAGFEVVREVLPIVDNLERALRSEGSVDDLKAGVEMVARQLQDALRTFGVERVAATGEPFDPRLHQAVAREEQPDLESPTVSEELLSGYTMHERLIRPATVKVAVPAQPETDENGESH